MPLGITNPPDAPSLGDPASFPTKAAAFVAWFPTFITDWENLSAEAFFAVQTALDELATGKTLQVGSFGLGTSFDAGNVDDRHTSGFYFGYGGAHASASAGDNPFPNFNGGFSLIVNNAGIGGASEYIVQKAVRIDAVPMALYRVKTTDGAGWTSWRPQSGVTLVQEVNVSAVASVDFTLDTSIFTNFRVVVNDLMFSVSDTSLVLRTSTDGGSSFELGASDYFSHIHEGSGVTTSVYGGAASSFACTGLSGTVHPARAEIQILGPGESVNTGLLAQYFCVSSSTAFATGMAGGQRDDTGSVDAIRLRALSGTISGKFSLYGVA